MAVQISSPNHIPKRSIKGDVTVFVIIISILAVAFVLLFFAFKDYNLKRNMELIWTKIQHIADEEDPDMPDEYVVDGKLVAITDEVIQQDYLYRPINLAGLREVNADVSGYIYIPNTQVNYPILKEPEPEKYFYLDHNIYKNSDKYGSVFEICDEERGLPEIDNGINIIFGHHMASGAMFSGIYSYQEQDFMKNPIYIYRDEYRIEYEAFAVCVVHKTDPLYDFDAYPKNSDNIKELLQRMKTISVTEYDGEYPDGSEEITVLSTCKGAAGTPNRLVVFLKEVRRAETPEYYHNLEDVEQYGGDHEGIDPSTVPGYLPNGEKIKEGVTNGGVMNELLQPAE